jgi:hypothetical protein
LHPITTATLIHLRQLYKKDIAWSAISLYKLL